MALVCWRDRAQATLGCDIVLWGILYVVLRAALSNVDLVEFVNDREKTSLSLVWDRLSRELAASSVVL